MKQLIKNVLNDMSMGQITLSSNSARELIATTVTSALKTKGSYKEYTDYELNEQEARATWVCSICGENTADVEYDYLGSGTNHLGCELKIETDNKAGINPNDDSDDYTKSDDTKMYWEIGDNTPVDVKEDEVYHVIKHLGYATKNKKQTVVGKITKSQLNNLYTWHEEEQ